ncbi:MAG: hypothetical protein K8T25_05050 [Planctomycetia bacterium]|nr:hypothetical protein [Planctomycetia bacterium]
MPVSAADQPSAADRQRIHDQQIQQQRNALDNRINAARRQLESSDQQCQQTQSAIPDMQRKVEEARAGALKLRPDVEAAKQEVDKLREQWKQASSELKQAQSNLDAIGDKLEKDQPSSSPLSAARARYESQRKQYQAAVDHVLDSPEYKAAYKQAQDAGEREEAADLRSQYLKSSTEVSDLSQKTKAARVEYEALRDKLIRNDSGWQAGGEDVKKAKDAEAAVRKQGTDALRKANEALRRYQTQVNVSLRGDNMVKQAQAAVKNYERTRSQMQSQIQQLEQQRNNLR